MNIIENLYKRWERQELIKWTVLDLENLETREENKFPGYENYIIDLKKEQIRRKKLKYKDLFSFSEDLKISLDSGLTILEALEISKENTDNIEILIRSEEIKKHLIRGENIATSWAKAFPEEKGEIVNIISLYEESGAINLGFEKIASYLKEKIEYRKKFFKTMYYPFFILALTTGVFIWFINIFIPSMLVMLGDVMSSADYIYIEGIYKKIKIGVNTYALVNGIFIMYLLIAKKGRKKIVKKISHFKVFRKIANIYYLEAFSHYYYYLIKSGFSIIKSLEILKKDDSFVFCKEETESCLRRMKEGHSLNSGMKVYDFIGKKELLKIKKGEIRGTLMESFKNIHVQAQQEKTFYFTEVLSYLEPFMILLAGLVVGLSVYVFYWVLFSYTFTLI